MSEQLVSYRELALAVWGAVSLVLGMAVASWFRLEGRELVFVAVLAVGMYGLGLLWFAGRRRVGGQSMVEEKREAAAPGSVAALTEGAVLSGVEAQEWLDRFLVEQQATIKDGEVAEQEA